MILRAALVATALVLGAGCDDTEADARLAAARGADEGRSRIPEPPTEPPVALPEVAGPRLDPPASPAPPAQRLRVPVEVSGDDDPSGPQGERERDLSDELRRLVGDPSPCIGEADLRGRVTFSITAHVSTTGLVTRASVSAAGVPERVTECVRARVESSRFAADVPGAPRAVTASVAVEPPPPSM